ncbi:isoleucyl-tRNA synthetase [Pedobacter sp. HDW13]|uniref:isoleucyl-tRNA synthetase n=1 Tax=unclassified Pedobacter TaxID=2628915 RepID=UPI000F5A2E1F|nr:MULTISPECIES: isoleucyl-tRNA synthetase [unclassified Pedobacter]QIL38901.1 isoleucyl-tRNA synthetase [Pedobacter sp. HDW13]RQO72546.1 isoleucyl-tRNA synthetase [Pedobacter sp. KBW01]
MIRLLKLQKAVWVLVLGILTYIAYKILETYEVSGSRYVQMLAGVLVMAGALWMLYPILFAKKDNDGNAEIITDPTVEIPEDEEEDKPVKE